ncbi:unannotated protein [freshwater metagenome]|uniref:Unannotated protein n=1 Tax=freshwater metagenome TaxID=449393 RepID=A0A6J7DPL8_9ZZZZ
MSGAEPAADHRSGIAWGIGAYALWGLVTIYWKALKHFNAFELIGYRITASALVMGTYVIATGRMRPLLAKLRNRALLMRVTIGALVLAANWTIYVWAVVHGRVIETALGYFMTPIGLTLAGVLVMHERLWRAQQFASVLAVAAMVVLTLGYGHLPWVSIVIAATWITYTIIKKQATLTAFESLTAETLVLFIPAVGLVLWGAGAATGIPQSASGGELVLVALSGLVTAVPLLMFAVAAKRLPLSILALVQYIVPTINFLLGWLAYGETLTTVRVIGFVLVWIGLAAVTIDSVRRIRPAA